MNNQPNWLDIEQQLYPEIYISKRIRIETQSLSGIATPIEYKVLVPYNSLHREINVTDALNHIVSSYFNAQTNFDAHFFDFEENKFKLVGSFPFKEPVLLKGIFVENENLLVKLSAVNQQINSNKIKNKTDKTLKFVLQKVAQWRKIHIDSQKKINLEQAANIIGISRNTLDDYYFQIKLAENYGFNFQENLQQPFQNLRKYVKQNQQKKNKNKGSSLPNILQKFKPK